MSVLSFFALSVLRSFLGNGNAVPSSANIKRNRALHFELAKLTDESAWFLVAQTGTRTGLNEYELSLTIVYAAPLLLL